MQKTLKYQICYDLDSLQKSEKFCRLWKGPLKNLSPVMLRLAEMLAKTEPMVKCNGTPFGTHFTAFQDTPRKLPTAFKLCAINHIHSIKPHDDLRIGGYEVTHNGLISILKDISEFKDFTNMGA